MPYLKTPFSSALFFSCILLIAPVNSHADPLIKSVDADGNVTYSDTPVANAKTVTKVPILAGPNNSEINAAQQQAEKKINTANKIDKQNADELEKRKARQKQYTAKKTADTPLQPDVIYTGSSRLNPYVNRPRPRPPINRPGINPPVTIQPVPRPRPRVAR